MTINISLPNVRLENISGDPKLFVLKKPDIQDQEKKPWIAFLQFLSQVGEYSPYMKKISLLEKDWIKSVIDLPVETIISDIISDLRNSEPKSIINNCQRAKQRGFLIAALFDLAGFLSLDDVSKILTLLADEILEKLTGLVFNHGLEVDQTYKLQGSKFISSVEKKAKTRSLELFVIAMGKMGAYELNYSSDIDIIFFITSTANKLNIKEKIGERQEYIKKAKKLIKILSSVTNNDFIYRTDLRLRPDPASTSIVISTEFAETYYQKLGRTWERMAFIKARFVAGNKIGAQNFLKILESFIWRKHFDYASIEDVKNLREKMNHNTSTLNLDNLSGYNIKTGLGGIRDIELFTQTYQLIVGGKQKKLRDRKTIISLRTLATMKWLKKEQAKNLIDAYTFLRNLENRLQIINNTQTQILPNENTLKFNNLALLLGFEEPENFKKEVKKFLFYVKHLTDDFFTNFKFREVKKKDKGIVFSNISYDKAFQSPNEKETQRLYELRSLPLFKSERASRSFNALLPRLVSIVGSASNPVYTLDKFTNFLRAISSGVQLFPLLENNPGIIDMLIEICDSSDSISKMLAKDIKLFDLLISDGFLEKINLKSIARSNLKLRLKETSDFEFILNELRRFAKERKVQISIHLILSKVNAFQAAEFFSETAEICIDILLPLIEQNLKETYGFTPGHVPSILAMGKLGSKEMNYHSDLDLILIYNSDSKYIPGSRKDSSLSAYFARFTQALVSAFNSLTEEGRLYEVDMRLRPSGRAGPVATSLIAFKSYQKGKAWVWEHLALSRGRIISGDANFKKQVLNVFDSVFMASHHTKKIIKRQTSKMRQTLGEQFSHKFLPPDIKFGRGGMQELELLVQMGFLLGNLEYKSDQQSPRKLIKRLLETGFFSEKEASEIFSVQELYFNFQLTIETFKVAKSGKDMLSQRGLNHLISCSFDRGIRSKINTIECLYKLLSQKANLIGLLFDNKLKM